MFYLLIIIILILAGVWFNETHHWSPWGLHRPPPPSSFTVLRSPPSQIPSHTSHAGAWLRFPFCIQGWRQSTLGQGFVKRHKLRLYLSLESAI